MAWEKYQGVYWKYPKEYCYVNISYITLNWLSKPQIFPARLFFHRDLENDELKMSGMYWHLRVKFNIFIRWRSIQNFHLKSEKCLEKLSSIYLIINYNCISSICVFFQLMDFYRWRCVPLICAISKTKAKQDQMNVHFMSRRKVTKVMAQVVFFS